MSDLLSIDDSTIDFILNDANTLFHNETDSLSIDDSANEYIKITI